MKVKLLTIVILALLLCATVPIAATAAKDKNKITEPVYLATRTGPNTNDPIAIGQKKVGTITIDKTDGTFYLQASNVLPGDHVLVLAHYTKHDRFYDSNAGVIAVYWRVHAAANGIVSQQGTCVCGLDDLNNYLNTGAFFAIENW